MLEALAEAAARSLRASWVVLAFTQPVFLDQSPPVVVRHPEGRIVHGWSGVPQRLEHCVTELLSAGSVDGCNEEGNGPIGSEPTRDEPSQAGTHAGCLPRVLGASMCFAGESIGAVAVELPRGAGIDMVDRAMLATLANYGALALDNAFSFQERERLREVAEVAGRQAGEHARSLAQRERELHLARENLDQLNQRQLMAAERQRIASELHDSVTQQLLALGVSLSWCCQQLDEGDPLRGRLAQASQLAGNALEDVRTAIFRLSPLGPNGAGLAGALAELAESVARTTGLQVHSEAAVAGRFPSAVERAMYYVVEEVLFNVVRHAQAKRVWLTLNRRGSWLRLVVADDGVGDPSQLRAHLSPGEIGQFDLPSGAPRTTHRGLAHVAWRANSLGGRVWVSARAGGGVCLHVSVPL